LQYLTWLRDWCNGIAAESPVAKAKSGGGEIKELDLDAIDPAALLTSALESLSADRHGQAIAYLTKVIELRPQDPAPYYYRGLAYLAAGLQSPAITEFSSAISLASTPPPSDKPGGRPTPLPQDKAILLTASYYARAEAWEQKGLLDRAMVDFASARIPSGSPLLHILAQSALRRCQALKDAQAASQERQLQRQRQHQNQQHQQIGVGADGSPLPPLPLSQSGGETSSSGDDSDYGEGQPSAPAVVVSRPMQQPSSPSASSGTSLNHSSRHERQPSREHKDEQSLAAASAVSATSSLSPPQVTRSTSATLATSPTAATGGQASAWTTSTSPTSTSDPLTMSFSPPSSRPILPPVVITSPQPQQPSGLSAALKFAPVQIQRLPSEPEPGAPPKQQSFQPSLPSLPQQQKLSPTTSGIISLTPPQGSIPLAPSSSPGNPSPPMQSSLLPLSNPSMSRVDSRELFSRNISGGGDTVPSPSCQSTPSPPDFFFAAGRAGGPDMLSRESSDSSSNNGIWTRSSHHQSSLELATLFASLDIDARHLSGFIQEEYNMRDLPHLSEDELSRLIPAAGPRWRLLRYLAERAIVTVSPAPGGSASPPDGYSSSAQERRTSESKSPMSGSGPSSSQASLVLPDVPLPLQQQLLNMTHLSSTMNISPISSLIFNNVNGAGPSTSPPMPVPAPLPGSIMHVLPPSFHTSLNGVTSPVPFTRIATVVDGSSEVKRSGGTSSTPPSSSPSLTTTTLTSSGNVPLHEIALDSTLIESRLAPLSSSLSQASFVHPSMTPTTSAVMQPLPPAPQFSFLDDIDFSAPISGIPQLT
jgi:hypothetical protein